ncbi:MAG: hypothetical protein IPK26_24640 [Planctomycetes bacterium]|nr:hypothetical protein [Planctomycetota bacterium]
MPCSVHALRVASLLAAGGLFAQDPVAEFTKKLGAELGRHPFFANVDFTIDGSTAPYQFYIQRPAKDDPTYNRQITNGYLPFLKKLTELFTADYVTPLGLQRSPQAPAFAIAVLASAGNYRDYAQAVQDSGLHWARAHYTPSMRLAITYEDRFAQHNTNVDERRALLHEFVHALQHAYSTTGEMPKAAWFNEGLADYRSSCTHVATSLDAPPLLDSHLATVANGHLRAQFRRVMLPLADLVAQADYGAVIAAVKARPGGAFDQRLALQMFYAQSELLVRFLHEGQGGKYRPGFLDYTRRMLAGEAGLPAFQAAFAATTADALAAIEHDFLGWQTEVFRGRYGKKFPDLAKVRDKKANEPMPLPPPIALDLTGLAFTAADVDEQVAGARRLCSRGDYEGALAMLPAVAADPAKTLQVAREQQRIEAVIALRDAVLADAAVKKPAMVLLCDGVEHKGKFVRREADAVFLTVGKEERRLPLRALAPAALLKLRKFEGKERGMELWLKWLSGASEKALAELLKLSYSTIDDLRGDVARPLDAEHGAAAAALWALQRLAEPTSVADAQKAMEAAIAAVLPVRHLPLLQARREAVLQVIRALAERAFAVDDAATVGIRGAVQKLGDGRLEVRYPGGTATNADFTAVDTGKGAELDDGLPQISYDGPTQLAVRGKGLELIGSGVLRWAVGLRGRQEIELTYEFAGFGVFGIVVCLDEETGSHLTVQADGTVTIVDTKTRMVDQLGSGIELFEKQRYRLRIVHDGEKRLETWVDGKRIAEVPNVGSCVRGDLCLFVRSSNAIKVGELKIVAQMDPADPLPLREAFVTAAQTRLWQ